MSAGRGQAYERKGVDRHQLDIRRMVKGLGLTLDALIKTRKHMKGTISKDGKSVTVIFPVSPSDHRWRRNMESYLRKTFEL